MMNNIIEKLSLITLVVLFLFTFYGCARRDLTEEVPEIVVAFWGSPEEIDIISEVIRDWDSKRQDVRVTLDHTPYSGYVSKVLTQIAGRVAPDIMAIEVNVFPGFWARDVFLDLTPFIEKDEEFSLYEFFPDALERFTIDGRIYGIPRDTAPFACIYFNKRLFREAGICYPTDDWNWDDFLKKAKALTQRDEDGRITRHGFYTWAWENFVYSNKGRLVDSVENPTKITLNSPEAIEGLQFYVDLIKKYRIAPSPVGLVDLGMDVQMMFMTERLAMFGSGIWETPALRKIEDFEWDVVMFPKGPDGIRAFGTGGTGYSILKSTKHPELAWEVVKALTRDEAQIKLAKTGLAQPANREIAQGPYWGESPLPPKNKDMLNEAVGYVIYEPFHPRWSEIRHKYIVPQLDLVFLGIRSVEEAVEEIALRGNLLLLEEAK